MKMQIMNIALLTGGRSNERDRSLLTCSTVDLELRAMGHRTTIFDIAEPSFLGRVNDFDVAFLAVAGEYGEDGRLQGCLDTLRMSYTGSGVLASAAGMDKLMFKSIAQSAEIPVLPDIAVPSTAPVIDVVENILSNLKLPILLKPTSDGCSNGISICYKRSELEQVVEKIRRTSNRPFMAEEFLENATSVTVGVLEINGKTSALPALEIVPNGDLYDAKTKRTLGAAQYYCPARLSGEVSDAVRNLAVRCHELLGCRSHSRVDFVVRQDEIFVLEINTLPGLSKQGNLATAALANGISYRQLLQAILNNAFTKSTSTDVPVDKVDELQADIA
ncbi:D-alanine--D-alanine ligase family protein [Burkholderia contaminans]|uniref:D-alanine--D-alanine ligase family protein n=1 Tax=Burkholderia contaminans TaxID=488447 RepID=UPI00158B7683|nr:D-alanine--D-alanine ligase [Burkholderia contaminans]